MEGRGLLAVEVSEEVVDFEQCEGGGETRLTTEHKAKRGGVKEPVSMQHHVRVRRLLGGGSGLARRSVAVAAVVVQIAHGGEGERGTMGVGTPHSRGARLRGSRGGTKWRQHSVSRKTERFAFEHKGRLQSLDLLRVGQQSTLCVNQYLRLCGVGLLRPHQYTQLFSEGH